MYLDFYEFESNPFHPSREPRFCYPSRGYRATMAELEAAVERRAGLILVTGAASTGKTTILEAAARQDWPEGVIPVAVTNPLFPFSRLLHSLHERLFPELVPPASQNEIVSQIRRELQRKTTRRWNVVLLLDEAQHIPTDTAAQLGRLLQIRNASGRAIQIVMFGQPELADRFQEKRLEHLRDVIGAQCEIAPLDDDETLPYIEHRVRQAVPNNSVFELPFERAAIEEIGKRSGGRPGAINRFCHEALVAGARLREQPVSLKTVQSVLPAGETSARLPRWAPAAAAAAAAFGAIALALVFGPSFRSVDAQPTQSAAATSSATATETAGDRPLEPPRPGEPPSEATPSNDAAEPSAGTVAEQAADAWSRDADLESRERRADSLATVATTTATAMKPRAGSTGSDPPVTATNASFDVTTAAPRAPPARPTGEARPVHDTAAGSFDATPRPSFSAERPATPTTDHSPSTPRISIVSYPIAEIWIDGESIGSTPIADHRVTVGKHFIEAVFGTERRTFNEVLREREHRKLTLRLDEEPE